MLALLLGLSSKLISKFPNLLIAKNISRADNLLDSPHVNVYYCLPGEPLIEGGAGFYVRGHGAYMPTKCKQVCFRYWEGTGTNAEWFLGHKSAVSLSGISTSNDLDDPLTRTDFILYQVNLKHRNYLHL